MRTCRVLIFLPRTVVLLNDGVEGTLLHVHTLVTVGVDVVLVDVGPAADILLARQILLPLVGGCADVWQKEILKNKPRPPSKRFKRAEGKVDEMFNVRHRNTIMGV